MDSRQISVERAEQIAGKRLDRRRRYAVIEDELCAGYSFTQRCSGCAYDDGTNEGCDECGYTGKRRHHQWAPLIAFELEDC